jgi:hypothetical protein
MAGRPAALEDENIVAKVIEESTRCKCFQSNADKQDTEPDPALSDSCRGRRSSCVFQ